MTPYRPDSTSGKKTNKVTSGFRLPERKDHNGIDCKGEDIKTYRDNKNVRCVSAGIVDQVVMGYNSGRGNTVYVRMPGGYRALYQHLNSVAVKQGQALSQGVLVGEEGWSGYCIPAGSGGSHLHFEVQKLVNGRWAAMNPAAWLGLSNAKGFYFGDDVVDGSAPAPPPEPTPEPEPEKPIGGIQMVKVLNVNANKKGKVEVFSAPDVKKVTFVNQLPEGLTFGDWTVASDALVPLANSSLQGIQIIVKGKVVWVALKSGVTKISERSMAEYYDYFVGKGRNN